MADEFAQRIKGDVLDGDTIVSTDELLPIAVKQGTTWIPLEVDSTSGGLKVDIVDATGITVDVDVDQVTDGQAVSTEKGMVFAGTDGSNYQFVSVTSAGLVNVADGGGSLTVDFTRLAGDTDSVLISDGTNDLVIDASGYITANINGTVGVTQSGTWNIGTVASITADVNIADGGNSITVDAVDLDIRDLSASQDNVAISDGTNTLAVNGDGSINVAIGGASDTAYHYGSANLVKDTATQVVSRSPSATEYFKGVLVSGAGLCQWTVQFGTTSSEATIIEFWTTPSNPTQYIDLPDSIAVESTETILVSATNRENASSPASDFSGFASLIRGA